MRAPATPTPMGADPANPRRTAQLVHTTHDSFGAVVATYFFFPAPRILYVRWHGHVTEDEFVRAAAIGLQLNQQWQPLGLFHDQRGTSGEWGDDAARAWVLHEWVPGIKAQCPNLRGIGLLLNGAAALPYCNLQLLNQMEELFTFRAFYALLPAWRWMTRLTQTRRLAEGHIRVPAE